ncbi:MAG: prevent-host-death protein [Gemmatimonadetes bacterium]|nr:prevent-host-death protein [Gemmatimonadota bacterium]
MLFKSKSKLKANMLRVFREIEESGEDLIVTHNRSPVLSVKPIKPKQSVDRIFDGLRGKIVYHGDIDTPTIDEWDET